MAAYLIPENLWYIIPEEMIRRQGSIAVYPRLKKSKYGRYREAWHLVGASGVEIQACADRAFGSCVVPAAGCNLPPLRAKSSRVPTLHLTKGGDHGTPPCITSPRNGKTG